MGLRPYDIPHVGRMAVLADPVGAVFCVWEPHERRGAQVVNEPNAWSMSALNTADPDRAASFYGSVFGWTTETFELGELAARARALLRRNGDGGRAPLRVGSLELDPPRHEASQAGEPLALTPKEFALLRYFMTRPGEALSEFELLTHVWDENANPLTRTVRVTVMTLRRKLAGNPI